MSNRQIQAITSAVARRLASRGGAASPAAARIASLVVQRLARGPVGAAASPAAGGLAPGLASAIARQLRAPGAPASLSAARLASLAIRRLGRTAAAGRASPAAERLASAVASAVARRLAAPSAAASPAVAARLDQTRLASSIAARIALKVPETRMAAPVDVASLDTAKIASGVTRRLEGLKESAVDPADRLASAIARRLATPQLQGSPRSARLLPGRVASTVVQALHKREERGGEVKDAAAAAEKPSPARKR